MINIDISAIDNISIGVDDFIEFTRCEISRHSSLLHNYEYKNIALCSSNANNFKKFFEEIVPLMFLLESQMGEYKTIKYMSGDQNGDALLDELITVEVTKAQHSNQYMVIQDILTHGYAFSPQHLGTNVTSCIVPTKTKPHVCQNSEHISDLALYIKDAISKKLSKIYPSGSILVVLFKSNTLMVDCDDDYTKLVNTISSYSKGLFSRIYIVENIITKGLKPRWQYLL